MSQYYETSAWDDADVRYSVNPEIPLFHCNFFKLNEWMNLKTSVQNKSRNRIK